jgi:hypothetical protein
MLCTSKTRFSEEEEEEEKIKDYYANRMQPLRFFAFLTFRFAY